jgi:hypothetical protein
VDDIEALRKEVLAVRGHQLALTFVVAEILTDSAAQDVERLLESAEAYLTSASLQREVLTGAREAIRAIRNTYRTS